MPIKLTAEDISELLRVKHSKDVYVPECNTGSAWAGCRRMDAWVMPRSWAKFATIGYEIKVERSDFTRDQKWIEYLDYCHKFYFVCPGGLIKAHELPKEVGLIWVSANGKRLHTKSKASLRDPDPNKIVDIMAYILMSRTESTDPNQQPPETKADRVTQYRELIEEANARENLASFVNEHIHEAYKKMEDRVREAERLESNAETLREKLKEQLGIEWDKDDWRTWEKEREIDRLAGRIPWELTRDLKLARNNIDTLIETIKEIRGENDAA